MYTTVNEEGILNNYAPKTSIYYAEYPAIWEQRRYIVQGAIATLLVGLLVLTALAVSAVG
ncbi:MAG: ssl1498 family light-harvesting-like protein [Cyanobacteriota bacterium]|nr:ssl1498 family light-harvesting-like protein [Cyanobacteriota bacterium]